MNKIDLPLFRISQNAFNWIAEDYDNPYYFVLHPDMTVSDFYIPDKAYPELTQQYLSNIKKLLSE
ncbi:MAG: hypothetical protein LBR48_05660 [Dysgonamonadaceae bacterium]|nr:hypothetical protein [Dysgonamonadaceae bacterium]